MVFSVTQLGRHHINDIVFWCQPPVLFFTLMLFVIGTGMWLLGHPNTIVSAIFMLNIAEK
jgi:hypothetical protein